MTGAEFDQQFARLAAHFHLPADESRDTIAADWCAALQHYHADALEHSVTELTRTATDRFWPALGKVLDLIKARIGRYDRAPGKCRTCNGSTWIDAQPWKSNGIVYEGLQRCPDCGVPPPQSHERKAIHALTSIEFHEHQKGRYGRDLMPPGMEAKHPETPGNAELKAWCEQLKKKLFGVEDGAA